MKILAMVREHEDRIIIALLGLVNNDVEQLNGVVVPHSSLQARELAKNLNFANDRSHLVQGSCDVLYHFNCYFLLCLLVSCLVYFSKAASAD